MGLMKRLLGGAVPASGTAQSGRTRRNDAYFPPPPPFAIDTRRLMFSRTIAGGERIELVGEGHRQNALDRVAGPKTEDGPTTEYFSVQLAHDPQNPFDSNAVPAYIGQEHVGYIQATDAPKWHDVIAHLRGQGRPATCQGRMVGGWRRPDGDTGDYGLTIFADYPLRPLGSLDPTIFSTRGRVAIQGEEHCQDYLFQQAKGRPDVGIMVELSINDGDRVQVQHDDEVLGWMTAAMTARYRPLVDHIESLDKVPSCSASITMGKKQLEVTLRLPIKNDLSQMLTTI